jgi:hypothetical protein
MSQKNVSTQDTTELLNSDSSTEISNSKEQLTSSRRRFLAQAGMAGLGAVAATQLALPASAQRSFPTPGNGNNGNNGGSNFRNVSDRDILNFALNLEYLEAEYYLRAAFGTTLDAADTTGLGNSNNRNGNNNGGNGNNGNVMPGNVIGFSASPADDQVAFSNEILAGYAREIARDEQQHVRLLRSVLGNKAVALPTVDIGPAFTAAAKAAGIIGAGDTFNPYANETNFLLGAFIFEDVGVTAYRGAAPLLNNKTILSAAAGLLGVEAYHAAEIRTLLTRANADAGNNNIVDAVQAISNLRDAADGAGDDDQGITTNDTDNGGTVPVTGGTVNRGNDVVNIVPTDANALVFARTFQQVLNIVYLTTAPLGTVHTGGFFPNGLNGRIR